MAVEQLITQHIDTWTSALRTRSTAGRGTTGKIDLYGIKKLRELILELAVRGKLVPQDPNDEPASELLKRIAAEKAELVKQGKIKKQKLLPEISEDEKPFELPSGWEWARLQDITSYIQRGKGPTYDENGTVYVVSQKCVQWTGFNLTFARFISDTTISKYGDERFLREHDLLWNSTGTGTAGRIIELPSVSAKRLVADSHVTVIRPLSILSSFLCSYISSFGIQSRIEPDHENTLVSGTTNQVELSNSAVSSLPIPIPPSNEQNKIATTVQSLLSLCDQLEQQSLTSLEAHSQLVETLLATLTDSQNAEELAENWARISQHFDTLFTTEASIDALKQTILQLAVMGKLTEQEKACTLECKTPLIDGLSIYDDINERIPKTWVLSKLDNISSAIIDCPHSTPKWADKGFICVRTNQIKPGYLELNDSRHVSEQTYIERIQRLEPSFNDILYSREGGVLGVACRIPEGVKVCLGQRMMLIRSGDRVLSEYLEIVLNSPFITILARQMTTGGAAPRINVSTVKNYLIPLPPKEEQYQIIARVKELLNLGDTLKSRLQSAQQTQLHLADALTDAAIN
ncbi:restriction endonuclease subunit S [Yersinia alsatica]|uniref:restriction endonuclease subunit S n=1 Tax=Yersinia alsatica TaxID=2890317 RepID=UPI00119EAFD1|nr:restriction endonuclease subunit S [Yersinia alsatica]